MKEEKQFLTDQFSPVTINAKFLLQQLIMKDLSWKMKIKVEDILPRTFYKYDIDLMFDDAPYDRQISSHEKDIYDIRNNKQAVMFEADIHDQIADIEAEIERVKGNMRKREAECPKISMLVTVEELKYSGTDTIIVFKIPDMVISELNDNKLKFDSYKIQLRPEN